MKKLEENNKKKRKDQDKIDKILADVSRIDAIRFFR